MMGVLGLSGGFICSKVSWSIRPLSSASLSSLRMVLVMSVLMSSVRG